METVKIIDYADTITEIGVISDTHIPSRAAFLPPAVYENFRGVQLILHAGDLVDEKVIIELKALAPVEAVAGNMDPHPLVQRLGRLKLIRIGEVAIALLHGDLAGRRVNFEHIGQIFLPHRPRAVVFGHLHESLNSEQDGVLYFNPGSATDPRRTPRPSIGRLSIENGMIKGRIIKI